MAPRILVAFYSRTGNTTAIAESIAAALGADLEPIIDHTRRSGPLGYLRSGFDAFFHRPADIGPAVHDPTAYDLVIVGTPIWNVSLSSPVRSYLRGHRKAMPAVAFFCTCGGMGIERVFAQMAKVCGKQPAATLAVRESEMRSASTAIARFAAEITKAIPIAEPQFNSFGGSRSSSSANGTSPGDAT